MNRVSKLLISLGLIIGIGFSSDVNAAITFKSSFKSDDQLAKCVASNLNKNVNDVTNKKELESIVHLDCENAQIKSIDDISDLKNLKSVNLAHNNITSVAELNVLKLNSIDLSYNRKIKDINTLYYVGPLRELSLNGTELPNIEILGDFKDLTTLSLSDNKIKDASFLGSLKRLTELDVSSNEIKSLAFSAKLGRLQQLDASYNKLDKVMFLPTNIKTINISNNKIDTMVSLKNNQAIYYLDIANNRISDVSFLENNLNLKYLDISFNNVTSIEKLNNLAQLQVVTLDYDKITDKDKLNETTLKLYKKNEGEFTVAGMEDKASVTNKEDLLKYLPYALAGLAAIITLIAVVLVIRKKKKAKEYTAEDDKITLDIIDTKDENIVAVDQVMVDKDPISEVEHDELDIVIVDDSIDDVDVNDQISDDTEIEQPIIEAISDTGDIKFDDPNIVESGTEIEQPIVETVSDDVIDSNVKLARMKKKRSSKVQNTKRVSSKRRATKTVTSKTISKKRKSSSSRTNSIR